MGDSTSNSSGRRFGLSRRSFLSLPLVAPVAALRASGATAPHASHYDHVIGTSLDLAVWGTRDAAGRAEAAVVAEVDRLAAVLSTYTSESEISQLDPDVPRRAMSRDLAAVLAAYVEWEHRTFGALSVRPGGPGAPMSVDALGKAYIIDRALAVARQAAPDAMAAVLNIGGDLAVFGSNHAIDVADPDRPYDNAEPLTRVSLSDAAAATSGRYARGAHIRHASSGRSPSGVASATAIAPDCLTANALATALCVLDPDAGLRMVDDTPGAHALIVFDDGREVRSAGFSTIERQRAARGAAAASWPAGYELIVSFTLTGDAGGRARLPYFAAWVETPDGTLVRTLAVWGGGFYFRELPAFWDLIEGNDRLLFSLTKATRAPGRYQLVWDGLDAAGKPAPAGNYRVMLESNQEHAFYAKQSTMIACGDAPVTTTMKDTTNFESITLQYGPHKS